MNRQRAVIVVVGLMCASLGCAATRFLPNEGRGALQGRSPSDPDRVLVLLNDLPKKPFKIVGTLDVSFRGAGGKPLLWFTDELCEEAAALGADGVMNLKIVRGATSGFGTATAIGGVGIAGASGAQEIAEMTAGELSVGLRLAAGDGGAAPGLRSW